MSTSGGPDVGDGAGPGGAAEAAASLRDADRRAMWHPFTQMRGWMDEDYPVIVGAEGCELVDADGRRYLDGISTLWCALHGHRVPALDAAVRDQLDKVAHSTLLGLANEPSIRLAERLVALAPGDLTRVFYSDSGSTAVEIALKMAFQSFRQADGAGGGGAAGTRSRFLYMEDSYHGDTLGSVSVGGIELFHELFQPLLFAATALPVPRGPDAAARAADVDRCLGALDAVLAEQGAECCALVIEPGVQGAAGIRPFPEGFTRAVVERCRAAGMLVVADEVATGFGRSGALFACEREGIAPDLLCLAKALSGGYLPLAATLATERLFEAFLGEHEEFRTFFHGHTFTGNPLACAAGLASLELCADAGFLPRARELADALERGLAPLAEHPHVLEVRAYGTMAGVELVAERGPPAVPFPAARRTGHRVTLAARERGVILRPLGDSVVLMPPHAVTDEQLERLLAVTREAVDVATR